MATVRQRIRAQDEEEDSYEIQQEEDEDDIELPEHLSEVPNEDELWNEGDRVAEVRLGGKRRAHDVKRIKKLRQTILETGIRTVVHMVLLALYLAVHVHNDDQFKRCPEPTRTNHFYGGVAYAGEWKFLTHICMWFVGVHFFLAFFTDIMPISPAKQWFRQLSDWFFTTIAWPLALMVGVFFWGFYLVDPSLIRKEPDISECFPDTLNHALHTIPLITVFLECVLIYHRYSSNMVACFTVFTAFSSYGVWVLFIFTVTKMWAYPFLSSLTPVTYMIGMFFFSLMGVVFYFLGRLIASVRWKERFETQNVIDSELYTDEEKD